MLAKLKMWDLLHFISAVERQKKSFKLVGCIIIDHSEGSDEDSKMRKVSGREKSQNHPILKEMGAL